MLNCDSCDYFSIKKNPKLCGFADHLFLKNPLVMDEYPCQDISYDSYLLKNKKNEAMTIVA